MYRLLLGPRAQKDLDRLIGDTWVRVREALASLTGTLRPKGCVKLSTGAWRIRVGDIRVLHDIDDKARTVEVLRIKHRREVYRGL
ncbi:MAG: type II toxin-antitoxin system RelE/ParE family toxin [Candidatus Methylomirabilis oxygeniifera]|uniref:Plasmid stabilization system n=1 Tax=Methylomirabilis oxygeniifera TaxID=671143 RepID=D5MHY9_METO1|nr:MAG: type II toxin-antitoxin system RelE/ParE family toxin [Candidatus Methylomirabilis oxyfera]CBE69280.1 Plasmid stabilization system [Candidatus Methylomirabilis oxyfera]